MGKTCLTSRSDPTATAPLTAPVILILPPTAPPTHLPRTPATATVTHILQPTPPHTAEDTATATPTAQPTAPPTATVILMAPPTATPMATAARHSAFTVGSAASSEPSFETHS